MDFVNIKVKILAEFETEIFISPDDEHGDIILRVHQYVHESCHNVPDVKQISLDLE